MESKAARVTTFFGVHAYNMLIYRFSVAMSEAAINHYAVKKDEVIQRCSLSEYSHAKRLFYLFSARRYDGATMKCPHDIDYDLSELHVGGTVAHVCKTCHGLLFKKSELESLKDSIQDHEWFDVSLWENKELLSATKHHGKCPVCSYTLSQVDWKKGEFIAMLCSSCGSMWLPKGEYQKAIRYIKEVADSEVMENYGGLLSHEIEKILSSDVDAAHEAHNLKSLLSFFSYRFITKHPLLTEVIEELPFAK